jgi:biotin carboxylase/ribosomal protein S18 acetylase RimI-like enzyme
MERHVLFLFGGQACIPSDPLLAAKRLGCRTTVMGPSIPCGVAADMVDQFERVRLSRPDEVIEAAQYLHGRRPIAGVVGYDDEAVPLVARVAAALGLPGHPVEAADAARDKVLMKQRFAAAGLPIARYTVAAGEDAAVDWAATNGYPVVVKPRRGSASQGVIRANTEAELREAYRRLRRIVRENGLDTGGRSDAEQLVEGYLDGQEISVELLIRDGDAHVLCLFEKPAPLHGPFFEETIYVTPTSLAPAVRAQAEELAIRAAHAVGLRTGLAHCEIRLASTGPHLLEIAGRVIGGACSRVFRSVLGEDIHPIIIRLAMGESFALPRQQAQAAGAMMLPIPEEGRLVAVRGVDQARRVAGIQDVIVTAEPGDVIVPFPEQSCYVGFLTARADSPAEVATALSEAAHAITLELAPLSCEAWTRPLDDQRDYEPPAELGIRNLAGLSADEAREVVIPLVAATHFAELPHELALSEARQCVAWLDAGNRGETSPAAWFVADGRGVALGSFAEEMCYISCLGVAPGGQRSGLGEALLRSIMAQGAARGCTTMEEFADPRHTAGMGLFERLGFIRNGADDDACCTTC